MRRRRPRTIVGAWAAAGTEAGFWLGMAFAVAAIGAPVAANLTGFAGWGGTALPALPSPSTVVFYTLISVFALIAGWVIGSMSGLVIGALNGLVLFVLARTSAFQAAAPRCRRRVAAVVVIVATAGVWVAAQSVWQGFGLSADRIVLVYLPAAAGAVIAGRLSGKLPPVRS